MDVNLIIVWAWENKEIIGLFAVIATALGTLYQPTRDLISILPRATWAIIKFSLITVWYITCPIRKVTSVLYFKFAEKHFDRLAEKISEYFEKREAAKEAAEQ